MLEDPKVGTRNYKFFVEMGTRRSCMYADEVYLIAVYLGFRLEEFQTVCNLVDEGADQQREGTGGDATSCLLSLSFSAVGLTCTKTFRGICLLELRRQGRVGD